jgi:hypothetical protein
MKGATIMKRLALAVAIASSALSIFAFDFTDSGFTQTGEKTVDGKTLAILADESGGEVLFQAEAEPSPARVAALRSIVAELRSWSDFQSSEVRAVNTADRLQITAIPSSFLISGTELAQALPGGIQLFYKTATEYDFKVKSGKYIVRVASVFTTEAELAAAALSAFKDPVAFISTRDPLYVAKALDDLESRIEALETATFGEASNKKDARVNKAEEDLKALKDELATREAALAAKDSQRDADLAKAKTAILAALNGGKTISPDMMAKLIELKKADMTLDRKTLPKALKAAGVTLKDSEIAAIFLVEFGERY